MAELAEMAQISVTLARHAKKHHIKIRPRGANSHLAKLNEIRRNDDYALLDPVLARSGGFERLRRLTVIARHHTLEEAAASEGIARHTLRSNMRTLERDFGATLFTGGPPDSRRRAPA